MSDSLRELISAFVPQVTLSVSCRSGWTWRAPDRRTGQASRGIWPHEGRASLLILLCATLGCRGMPDGEHANRSPATAPPEARPRPAFDLDEFVAEHNQNAERIRSLEAQPSITAPWVRQEIGQEGSVDGRLALERPRNFKLELSHSQVNRRRHRFERRAVLVLGPEQEGQVGLCLRLCRAGSTALAATYQPDWIVEAMGLKPITPDEATRIKVRPGPEPATTALIFPAIGTGARRTHGS